MASGSFSSSQTGGYTWILTYDHVADATTNSSTVTVSYIMKKTGTNSQSYNNYGTNVTININGTTYSKSGVTFDMRNSAVGTEKLLFSKTVTIAHNSDGTKTIDISASHVTGIALGTQNVSGTVTLTNIPRSKSTLSFGTGQNFVCGNTYNMTITSASSSFTHTLTATFFGVTTTITTKTTSKTVSWTVPASYINLMSDRSSNQGYITLETFNGSESLGYNTYDFTAIVPDNIVPSVSFSIFEGNSNVNSDNYYAGVSSLLCRASGSGNQGSSITEINFSSSTLGNKLGPEATYDNLTEGSHTITATVRDSRGRTASRSLTINALAYALPYFEGDEVNIGTLFKDESNKCTYILINNIKVVSTLLAELIITAKTNTGTVVLYKSPTKVTTDVLSNKSLKIADSTDVNYVELTISWSDGINTVSKYMTINAVAAIQQTITLSKHVASPGETITGTVLCNKAIDANNNLKVNIDYEFPSINRSNSVVSSLDLTPASVTIPEQTLTIKPASYDIDNNLYTFYFADTALKSNANVTQVIAKITYTYGATMGVSNINANLLLFKTNVSITANDSVSFPLDMGEQTYSSTVKTATVDITSYFQSSTVGYTKYTVQPPVLNSLSIDINNLEIIVKRSGSGGIETGTLFTDDMFEAAIFSEGSKSYLGNGVTRDNFVAGSNNSEYYLHKQYRVSTKSYSALNNENYFLSFDITGLNSYATYQLSFMFNCYGSVPLKELSINSLDGSIEFYKFKDVRYATTVSINITGVTAFNIKMVPKYAQLYIYWAKDIRYVGNYTGLSLINWNNSYSSAGFQWTVPQNFEGSLINSDSANGVIKSTLYNNSVTNQIAKAEAAITVKVPDSSVPTVNSVNISEGNLDITAITNKFVAGLSKLSVNIAAAPSDNNLALSYSTNIYHPNGEIKNYNTVSFTTDTITQMGTYKIETTVTDSRGRSTSTSKQIVITNSYMEPSVVKLDVIRSTDQGDPDPNGKYLKIANCEVFIPSHALLLEGSELKSRFRLMAYSSDLVTSYLVANEDITDRYSVTNKIYEIDYLKDWIVEVSIIDTFGKEVTKKVPIQGTEYVPLEIKNFEGFRSDEYGIPNSTGTYAKLLIDTESYIEEKVYIEYNKSGSTDVITRPVTDSAMSFNENIVIGGLENVNYDVTLVIDDGIQIKRKTIVIKAGTNFNVPSIEYTGKFKPTVADTPSDIRTRIDTLNDVVNVPMPYKGMIFYNKENDTHYVAQTLGSAESGGFILPDRKITGYRPLSADPSYLNSMAYYTKTMFDNKIANLEGVIQVLDRSIESDYLIDFFKIMTNVANNTFTVIWHIPYLTPGASPGENYKLYIGPASEGYVSYDISSLISSGKVVRNEEYFIYTSTFTRTLEFYITFDTYTSPIKTIEYPI